MIRYTILHIIGILSAAICCGQDTYVKSFRSFGDTFEFANSIVLKESHIFISSRGNCDSNGCAISMKLTNDGEIIWKNKHDFIYGGNSNTIFLSGDTLFLASYEPWKYPTYNFHLIFIDPHNGNTFDNFIYNYDTLSINGVNTQGMLLFNNEYLIYGEFRDNEEIASGLIQWANNKGNPIRTTTYLLPGNFTVNALQDLQPDGYGNLAFVTVYQDMMFDHTTVIRKLNTDGDVIKDVRIPSNGTLDPRPQLAVNKAGQYVFSHAKWAPGTVQQLVCTDTLGNILWEQDYPLKIKGQQPSNLSNDYHINQITPTSDGGVVIAARIRTNRIQNRFYDDAYIGKFDQFGTLEWERRINIQNGADTLYDWCALYDIKERPDGKGYVAVGSHKTSENLSSTNILLVSLDADGCIEGLACEGDHIVVNTLDVIDLTDEISTSILYPNPFQDQFTIVCEESALVRISDVSGKMMTIQPVQPGESKIETDGWRPGMYIIQIQTSEGKIKTYKMVKM
ncbi:MAG: T9SS type A sorting domain-containing protein [Saprospiraceae bacterium]